MSASGRGAFSRSSLGHALLQIRLYIFLRLVSCICVCCVKIFFCIACMRVWSRVFCVKILLYFYLFAFLLCVCCELCVKNSANLQQHLQNHASSRRLGAATLTDCHLSSRTALPARSPRRALTPQLLSV